MTMITEVELIRYRHSDLIAQTVEVLKRESIDYRVASDQSALDVGSLGLSETATFIILVPAAQEQSARLILLEDARASLSEGLPGDSPLHDFNEDELGDVLRHSLDWSPHDVAIAERLLAERNHEVPPVNLDLTDDQREGRKVDAADLKEANRTLIWWVWGLGGYVAYRILRDQGII
jgi:hypothetical protein